MTTNHPANGPVSLDRLRQISEILSKAAAQSDGGNLGYAMADAVKVIDWALVRRNADRPPVHPTIADEKLDDETLKELIEFRRSTFEYHSKEGNEVQTIIHGVVLSAMMELQERRSAMLQAANSPVTLDVWVACSERMPEGMTDVHISNGHDVGQGWWDGDTWQTQHDYYSVPGDVTHWLSLPAAPKQENTMDYITMLSPKLVSIGMFEQLSFHDDFSLKCRELGIHASKLGHVELSKKANDLMLSASLQQHDQLVDNMASLIELMADNYMRNTANSPVTPDGWIPVSERMPNEGQEIIVMDVVRGKVQSGMIYQNGLFVDFNEEYYEVKSPSHWMPLPAAPQQEE